jgi:hypothetical protein
VEEAVVVVMVLQQEQLDQVVVAQGNFQMQELLLQLTMVVHIWVVEVVVGPKVVQVLLGVLVVVVLLLFLIHFNNK